MTAPLGTNIVADSTIKTTITDSVNVCLSVVGEAPVSTATVNAQFDATHGVKETAPTQIRIALDTIEEVNREVQSRNYWFSIADSSNFKVLNSFLDPTGTSAANNDGNGWDTRIPQEARRYITIKAARVMQSRFIGNEELHKFSKDEELAAFAVLENAHILNTASLNYSSIPSDLAGMGVSDLLFLQSTVEEKFAQIKMVTELRQQVLLASQNLTENIANRPLIQAQTARTNAETAVTTADLPIKDAQKTLLDKQGATEGSRKLDIEADTSLKNKQQSLIDAQITTEGTQASKTAAEASLVTSQTLTQAVERVNITSDTNLKTSQKTLIDKQASDVEADTTLKGVQANLISTQASDVSKDTEVKDAQKTLITKQAETEAKQTDLIDAQIVTETVRASDVANDAAIKAQQEKLLAEQTKTEAKQTSLIDAQVVTETVRASDVANDAAIKAQQKELLSKQTDTESVRKADVEAETTLKGKQGSLIDNQATDVAADTTLKGVQATLTSAQVSLTEDQEAKTVAEKNLIESQKTQIDTQTALQLTEEKSYADAITGISSGTTYRDFGAELRMMGVQEPNFYELPAYKKKEALKDASKLRVSSATETGTDATEISTVNNIRRMIGEAPITALNGDSMASEAVRLLRKTSTEMQGRGWWFNTEEDVILTPYLSNTHCEVSGVVPVDSGSLHDGEANGVYWLSNSATRAWTQAVGMYADGGYSLVPSNSSGNHRWVIQDDDSLPEIEGTTIGSSNTTLAGVPQYPWQETWTSPTTITQANIIAIGAEMLSVETNDIDTRVITISKPSGDTASSAKTPRYLYNLKTQSMTTWDSSVKAKIIFERPLYDLPQKFKEYLEVRVAILLTEMYPRDGVDIQRLPRIERELEAYFKDRENDEGDYNIFDSYDASSRIGINRNYQLV